MGSWQTLSPLEQAAHPDTPPDRLLTLAHLCPDEVLENPILPLLLLGDPAMGLQIQTAADQVRVERCLAAQLPRLDLPLARSFAIECAARGLPRWLVLQPADLRLRRVLEVARQLTRGEAIPMDVSEARALADLAPRAAITTAARAIAISVYHALCATRTPRQWVAANAAVDAAREAAQAAGHFKQQTSPKSSPVTPPALLQGAFAEERGWQADHLAQLLGHTSWRDLKPLAGP